MKRFFIILLVLTLVVACASGCESQKETGTASSAIEGHWYEKNGSSELDFAADGVFTAAGLPADVPFSQAITYQADETQLVFTAENGDTLTVPYTIENGELTLTAAGYSGVYVRKAPAATEPETTAETTQTEPPTTAEPTQSLAETIIGTWSAPYQGYTLVYTFSEGGSGTASLSGLTFPIEYSTDNNVLSVTGYGFGTSDSGSAVFEVTNNQLIATKDGQTLVFDRVN